MWSTCDLAANKLHKAHTFQELQKTYHGSLRNIDIPSFAPLRQNKNEGLARTVQPPKAFPYAQRYKPEFSQSGLPVLAENLRCLNLGQGGTHKGNLMNKRMTNTTHSFHCL